MSRQGCDNDDTYDDDANVNRTAAASSGSTFGGWTGACSGTGPCRVKIDSGKSVKATFLRESFTLIANIEPLLSVGSVSLKSHTIKNLVATHASPDYGWEFYSGANVTIHTRSVHNGWVFDRWEGDCQGSKFCSVKMNRDRNHRFLWRFRPLLPNLPLGTHEVVVTGDGISASKITQVYAPSRPRPTPAYLSVTPSRAAPRDQVVVSGTNSQISPSLWDRVSAACSLPISRRGRPLPERVNSH